MEEALNLTDKKTPILVQFTDVRVQMCSIFVTPNLLIVSDFNTKLIS